MEKSWKMNKGGDNILDIFLYKCMRKFLRNARESTLATQARNEIIRETQAIVL